MKVIGPLSCKDCLMERLRILTTVEEAKILVNEVRRAQGVGSMLPVLADMLEEVLPK